MKRFWDKVEMIPFHTCWEWSGAKLKTGYGVIQTSFGRLAHRVSWHLHYGPIPNGKCVLHKCDNPGCVNPDHLFLGTQCENMKDMAKKGRARGARGERSANAKLTEDQVREMRSLYKNGISFAQLARDFNVSPSAAHGAVTGIYWKHIS